MNYITQLKSIAKNNDGIIETKTAAKHGISKAMLYKLCKENKIQRIIKDQYILVDDMPDELLSISKRSRKFIFSHETALFLHEISDLTPFEHTITAIWAIWGRQFGDGAVFVTKHLNFYKIYGTIRLGD